jgi:Ca2+-binding EF-hand superfamily protein
MHGFTRSKKRNLGIAVAGRCPSKNKNGKLHKTEVGDVLRELGRSEHQIQKMLDSFPAEDIDFEAFKTLLQEFPARRDFIKWFGRVPVPNPAKVHDVPLVGTATELAQDTLVDTYSATAQAALRSLRKLPLADLRAKFDLFDKDKSGKLEKKEQGEAMRSLGLYESEVKKALEHAGDKAMMTFDEFVDMVRNGGRWFTAR